MVPVLQLPDNTVYKHHMTGTELYKLWSAATDCCMNLFNTKKETSQNAVHHHICSMSTYRCHSSEHVEFINEMQVLNKHQESRENLISLTMKGKTGCCNTIQYRGPQAKICAQMKIKLLLSYFQRKNVQNGWTTNAFTHPYLERLESRL